MRDLTLLILLILCSDLGAQELKNGRVEILNSRSVTVLRKDTTPITILRGDVILRNSDGIFKCDSARWWRKQDRFKAFGNIHFIGDNGLTIQSKELDYHQGIADLQGNVILKQDDQILEAPRLLYDTNNEIGSFNDGGKVISNDGELTATRGTYEARNKLFLFRDKIRAITTDYIIDCDIMKQYPEESIYIIASDGTAKSESGELSFGSAHIDNKNNISSFFNGVIGKDLKMGFSADSLYKMDHNEVTRLFGDSLNPAKWINFSNDTMEIHSEFINHTPELTIARNDVFTFQNKLITNSENLSWNSKDSILILWENATTWSNNYQVISDSLKYFFRNKRFKDSIYGTGRINLSSKPDSSVMTDEMAGKSLVGFLSNGQIETLIVKGNAAALIHPETDKSSNITCSEIELNFKENNLKSIRFIQAPQGEIKGLESNVQHLPNYENRWTSYASRIDFMSGRK
jgi:lipopolysaccharide export system protein LptA